MVRSFTYTSQMRLKPTKIRLKPTNLPKFEKIIREESNLGIITNILH